MNPSSITHTNGRVSLFAALILAAIAASPGCQSYKARPLDADSTRAAWLARSPSDQTVATFAASLAAKDSPSTPFDPSDGLSLAEAEVVALVYNRDLRLARLEAGVTLATAGNAGRWDDPALSLDLERILSGVSDPWVLGAAIELTLPLSGRLSAERQRAGSQHAAALQRIIAREWAVRSAVRELWIEWSAESLRQQVLIELVERLRTVADLATRQEQAGVLARIDARVFRVELAGDEADMISGAARIRDLELQLRGLLGLSADAPLTLSPTVAYTGATPTDTRSLEATSPELAAIRAEYDVAEHNLRVEVRKQYPDLAIGPGYASDQGDDRLLLGLRLPVPAWNRNRQGLAEALAARDLAYGKFESTYEHLAMSLALARSRFESGRAVREAVETNIIPLAEQQDADVQRVAQLGRVDPLLILESVRSRHNAKVRLIDARAAESIGAIRLDELYGSTNRPPASPDTQPPSTGGNP